MELLKKLTSTKRASIISAAVAVLIIFGGTTAYAAHSNALPGSALFPLKQLWEKASLALSFSPQSKAKANINIAKDRVQSLQQTPAPTTVTIPALQTVKQKLNDAQNQASSVSNPTAKQEIEKEISKTASEAENEVEHEGETSNSQDKQNLNSTSSDLQQIQSQSSSDD